MALTPRAHMPAKRLTATPWQHCGAACAVKPRCGICACCCAHERRCLRLPARCNELAAMPCWSHDAPADAAAHPAKSCLRMACACFRAAALSTASCRASTVLLWPQNPIALMLACRCAPCRTAGMPCARTAQDAAQDPRSRGCIATRPCMPVAKRSPRLPGPHIAALHWRQGRARAQPPGSAGARRMPHCAALRTLRHGATRHAPRRAHWQYSRRSTSGGMGFISVQSSCSLRKRFCRSSFVSRLTARPRWPKRPERPTR